MIKKRWQSPNIGLAEILPKVFVLLSNKYGTYLEAANNQVDSNSWSRPVMQRPVLS